MIRSLYIIIVTLILILFIGCSKAAVKPDESAKLQEENASLASQNKDLSSKLAGLQSDYSNSLIQNAGLKDQLAKLQDDYSNSAAEIDSLNKDRDLDKEQLGTLQVQNNALMKTISKLSNDYLSMKNTVNNEKGVLGKQIDSLNATMKDNDQKMKALQDQINSKDNEIAGLEKRLESISTENSNITAQKDAEIARLTATSSNLTAEFKDEIANGDVKIKQLSDQLSIDFLDKIFFDSGRADIKKNGEKVLQRISKDLKNITDKQIRVEGYTDNVPIADKYKWKYPSNWELSTARATTIVRFLESQGVNPSLMKATGYGKYNPIASNDTEEGRAQNRRIVILLVPLDERARFSK